MKCKKLRKVSLCLYPRYLLPACTSHLFVSKPSKGTEQQRPSVTQRASRTYGNWKPWSCHSVAHKVIYRVHVEVLGQKQEAGTNPSYQNDALSTQIPACSRIKLRKKKKKKHKNLLYLPFFFSLFFYVSVCHSAWKANPKQIAALLLTAASQSAALSHQHNTVMLEPVLQND